MSEEQIANFLEMLKFPNKREKQMEEFKKIPDPDLVPHLMDIIYSSQSLDMRKTALKFLGEMEKQYVIKELIELTSSKIEKELRLVAIRELGKFKDEIALQTLEKRVNRSDDEDIIQAASIAIQVIQGVTDEDSQDLS